MAIPLSYVPSTLTQRASDISEEERESLRGARGKVFEPLNFDLDGAFVALSDKGYNSSDALDVIARKLSQKANFNHAGAKEAGFTNEQIVSKLIGRAPDDLTTDRLGSLVGGIGRGAVEGLPAGAAALTTGLGLTALGVGAPFVVGGSLLAAVALGLTSLGETLEEAVFDERQLLPGERGYGATGEVLGSVLSLSPATQVSLRSIPDAVDFGSKKLLYLHNKEKDRLFKESGKIFTEEGKPKNIKRREFLENIVNRIGEEARGKKLASGTTGQKAIQEAKNFAGFGLKELGVSAIPAAAEGFAEALYPGDDTTRTIAGLAAAAIPSPTQIAVDIGGSALGVAREDIKEKGLGKSALNLFGGLERGDRVRRQKAAEYIVRAYETAQQGEKTALEFADELDRLIEADPEFAKLLTPGQLTNDPFMLLMEASTRRGNAVLNEEQKEFGIKARDHMRQLIQTMRVAGSDDLLQEAGRLEKKAIETSITQLLNDKLTAAAEAADKVRIVRSSKKSIGEIKKEQGALLKDAAAQAVKDSKEIRATLYDQVDSQLMVSTKPILDAYKKLRVEFLLTEAGDLQADILRDLKNYGLRTDTGLTEILEEATSRGKTLSSRLNTINDSFKRTAANNPDAYDIFDSLVDTKSKPGGAKRALSTIQEEEGYQERLEQIIRGFSRKVDEEGAAGTDLSQSVRANILKLARQANEIKTTSVNKQALDSEIGNLELGEFFVDEPQMKPIGELLAFRKGLREKLRKGQRVPEPSSLNIPQWTVLTEGVTNAINQRIADGTVDGVMADNVKALDLAERYARAHQDVFRRSFVGKLDRQTPVGAEAIFEEEALDKMFRGGRTQNVQETLAAFNFRGVDGAPVDLGDAGRGTASGAIDAFLRTELMGKAKTVSVTNPLLPNEKPMTALTLDDRDVQQFLDRNREIIRALDPDGELIADLKNASQAKIALEAALAEGSERAKTHLKEINLGKFLGVSNAELVIENVLTGDKPDAGLKSLAQRINNLSAPDAQKDSYKEALFSTLVGHALKRSLRTEGDVKVIDFNKMYDTLYDTTKKRLDVGLDNYPNEGPSLMQILEQNGGVPTEQAEELKKFLERGKELQFALSTGADDFLDAKENQAVKDFIARFAGAQGIAGVTRMLGMSPTIQTTGAGAQVLRNQFINLPNMVVKDILIDVSRPGVEGAQSLRDLMRAGATPQEQNRIYSRLARNLLASPTYLSSVAVRGAETAVEEQPTLGPVPQEQPAAQPMVMGPPLPSPMPAAQAAPSPMPAPQAGPPPQGGVNPQQRQQFAALFPNDPISGLIQQQGIGSLPQAPG